MRFLIVEDDLGSRRLLEAISRRYGAANVAVNGSEAVEAFQLAWQEQKPYDVIFLDIMMPEKDGLEALTEIRAHEKELGIAPGKEVKVIMTTALEDPRTVVKAYYDGEATGYLVKPIKAEKIAEELRKLGML
ncbi:response regulator [Spirochaeta africana]|uniref:Response regulator with CheY-like receiver, AAA-type ATPase, and DNA-binding domains n=1 Tax=Spirochaeta africana (strain ATCC 700263 / DSM 8902 / Z-7692) TaxID=889378 RepID=H9UK78_SPIAZ|nr:response regulator [Spirochaeta africana]AFG37921.1 response regulator with CheY-like receiver, AAA-type ATPase, and DNA-binding domains [Spirochaeta africana DSM 8902]